MRYGTVCSGIEAPSVAVDHLGWEASFFSEIDKFPRRVLKHHFPDVPLHGDFTTIKESDYNAIDVLIGGTPCQSFSIAGLRGGLDDDRGNLALEYLRLADRLRPRWMVWENVPGVLSSNGGRDFGSIIGGMVELGYFPAYRILDAQHFGVPQRRRRVFVVGHRGDWRRSAAVLFEPHCLSGSSPPRKEAESQSSVSPALRAQPNSSHRADSQAFLAVGVKTFDRQSSGEYGESPVASTMSARDFKGATDLVLEPGSYSPESARTLTARYDGSPCSDRGPDIIANHGAVRRLTPVECERLQGFPDGWTDIPIRKFSRRIVTNTRPADRWRKIDGEWWLCAPDGPRYKALGNSMAVPVMRWILERLHHVDAM